MSWLENFFYTNKPVTCHAGSVEMGSVSSHSSVLCSELLHRQLWDNPPSCAYSSSLSPSLGTSPPSCPTPYLCYALPFSIVLQDNPHRTYVGFLGKIKT